jgi:hypothetical protein
MELPGITWVVVVAEEFSALYPKWSDDEGLGVIGVPIAAWITTALPARNSWNVRDHCRVSHLERKSGPWANRRCVQTNGWCG